MKVYVKLFAKLNLGDDLFLKILLERYPNVQFYMHAREEYRRYFKNYKNLTVILSEVSSRTFFHRSLGYLKRTIFPRLYRDTLINKLKNKYSGVFAKMDAFVSIGGSIFMQPKRLPAYFDVEFYRLVNKSFNKIYYLGGNFGPYIDESYKIAYEQIFKQATDVCFREKVSRQLFSNLTQVRCKPDVVFGLSVPKVEKKEKSIGFSIISARNGVNKNAYIEKYREVVQSYVDEGYDVYLFSFCKTHGDEDYINEIYEALTSKEKAHKVFYNGDIDSFLAIYGVMEVVFCGRFHAMILSMLFNQKVYPIVYSNKMTNVLSDIGFEGEYISMESFCRASLSNILRGPGKCKYDITDEKKGADEQFSKLDELLK